MTATVTPIDQRRRRPARRRRHPTASIADTFVPVPEYDRNPAIGNRTCPDCRAVPGEPCHWACSSWWS